MSAIEVQALKNSIKKEYEMTTISFLHFSKMYKMYVDINAQLANPQITIADIISINARRMTFLEHELIDYQKKLNEAITLL